MRLGAGAGKFRPPPSPPRLIERPRLTAFLNEASSCPLTLVSAGPGAGKTVLLSSWAAGAGERTAWLSVDPSDDYPHRLWRMVGRALLAAGIVANPDDLASLPQSGRDGYGFVTVLLDALSPPGDAVLVLDDAHRLTDRDVLADLDALIQYGFPRLRVVLGCRSDPMLPLHRYRLAGQLAELRAADLAMTRQEASALLAAHNVRLRERALDLLTERTEGWTAGLRLSAMTMSGSHNPERFVTQLATDRGSAGEYLIEEVLNQQPPDVRRLLIQTSFLDEVNGPLADAVTGIADCSELLAELARSNSFVTPLGRDRSSYRYHQLLADVLRYLLKHEYPETEADLRRRAAAWYASRDEPVAAIRFALSAEDWAGAADILVHGGFATAFAARENISDLAARVLTQYFGALGGAPAAPSATLAHAALAVLSGDVETGQDRLRQARAAHLDPQAAVTAALVDEIADHQTGTVRELDEAAEALLRSAVGPEPGGLYAAVRILQAATRYFNAEPYKMIEDPLLDGIGEAHEAGLNALELEGLGLLELVYASAGRSDRAEECATRSRALLRQNPSLQRMTVHHLARAYAAHVRLDVTAADRAIHRAYETMARDADHPLQAAVVLMHAWTLLSAHRPGEAHQLLTTAPELKTILPPRLLGNREYLLASIAIRMGRPHGALKILAEDPTRTENPLIAWMAARAYIALRDPQSARRCLRPALFTDPDTMPLAVLAGSALASAAIAALEGDDAAAVSEILRACDLAGDRVPQSFAEAYYVLADVLARHPEVQARWPRAASNGVAATRVPATTLTTNGRLLEPLTGRELTVLRRLTTTMTTQEIAQELCVSINTVKTHIAAIYRKLPAANRRDAAIRARALELR